MAAHTAPQPRLPHATPALLLLLTALAATALACQQLWTQDDTFHSHALRLLQDMAPSHTQPCHLQETTPFFPDTLRHNNLHPNQAAAIALRILHHLFHTLSTNSTRQHWHTQPRNDLLNKLQHYIHLLDQCLHNNATLFRGPRNTLLTINKYFRDIHLFLQAHNHSQCAWEHVRLQARTSLQHLHNLTRTMRR